MTTSKLPPSFVRAIALFAVLLVSVSATHGARAIHHVKVALVAERTSVTPGQPIEVGVHWLIDKGWHLYWKNAGDSGNPPSIEWSAPTGVTVSELKWPRPTRQPLGPLVNYGHTDELLLSATVQVPAGYKAPTLKIGVKSDWLVCHEECVLGEAELSLELPVSVEAGAPSTSAPAFLRARESLPTAWPADRTIRAVDHGTTITLTVSPALEGEAPYFFAAEGNQIEPSAPQPFLRDASGLTLTLKKSDQLTTLPRTLAGVLSVGTAALTVDAPLTSASPQASPSDGSPSFPPSTTATSSPAASISPASSTPPPTGSPSVAGPVAPPPPKDGPPPAGTDPTPGISGLLEALLLAFLGGIVLNVMPCVFPVLSLKALEVVQQAGEKQREIMVHGALYTLGILVSFWLLAGLLLVLRAGGQSLGWGFQLQTPGFSAGLGALLFVMSMSLLGVFEFEVPFLRASNQLTRTSGHLGAFFTGVLATIVSTPCTAPFMGTALGWAATQPAPVAMAVFTALGLGLAVPYLALSFSPALGRMLPRPGRWMETTKQALAFPLLATVIWLTWVVGLQTDINGVATLLGAYLVLGMATWAHGRWREGWPRKVATAAVLITFIFVARMPAAPAAAAPHDGGSGWEVWSTQRVTDLTAAGKPVFVDFTAAWCVSCKVNELAALGADTVADMRKRGITPLKGDWTRADPRITEALASFGRNGVPLYVVYSGRAGEAPRILPQILTPDIVAAELDRATRR